MEFQADLDHLPAMMSYIRSSLAKKHASGQQLYRVELASEEALVNIISYASPRDKILTIICHDSNPFEIEIRDKGLPFNPLEFSEDPKVNQPIEERKIGGLGIFLFKKLSEEIEYARVDDENVLTMKFKL